MQRNSNYQFFRGQYRVALALLLITCGTLACRFTHSNTKASKNCDLESVKAAAKNHYMVTSELDKRLGLMAMLHRRFLEPSRDASKTAGALKKIDALKIPGEEASVMDKRVYEQKVRNILSNYQIIKRGEGDRIMMYDHHTAQILLKKIHWIGQPHQQKLQKLFEVREKSLPLKISYRLFLAEAWDYLYMDTQNLIPKLDQSLNRIGGRVKEFDTIERQIWDDINGISPEQRAASPGLLKSQSIEGKPLEGIILEYLVKNTDFNVAGSRYSVFKFQTDNHGQVLNATLKPYRAQNSWLFGPEKTDHYYDVKPGKIADNRFLEDVREAMANFPDREVFNKSSTYRIVIEMEGLSGNEMVDAWFKTRDIAQLQKCFAGPSWCHQAKSGGKKVTFADP